MSYLALARKWRPRSFAELVGQEHVRVALGNALTQGRVHHAFLFTGTRGVGKTTIARILAKCLNCETGVTATPCGKCATCKRDRRGTLRRPHRSRRRVAHQGRRHARAARERAVRADARPLQGLPRRRSAHAVHALVQRLAEDARGTAAAREVPAGDHRSAETAGDGAVALPAVQSQAPAGGADQRAPRKGARGREDPGRCRRRAPGGAIRRWQHARCAVTARSADRLRRRQGRRSRRPQHARHHRSRSRGAHRARAGERRRPRS